MSLEKLIDIELLGTFKQEQDEYNANTYAKIGESGSTSITVDDVMSDTSTNPVQNKVIKEYVDSKEILISEKENNAIVKETDGLYVDVSSGKDGKSTYEIACDSGFEGSEEEWLESLKGEDGETPTIGTDNHWYINGVDTGVVAKGETPNIDSSTKHWFIGGVDTGIVAEGTNGTDGKDGIDGKDGKSISTITKDDDNNLIVTFTDDSTQNIGKLSIDIQGDFLTSDGFGNIRYYNGKFQYYNDFNADWVDIESTVENRVITCLTPSSMKSFVAKYNMVLDRNVILIEEPEDTIIDGQVLCFVEKVIIRRKINEVPINEEDGDLVTTILRKDFGSYSYNGYIDNDVDPSEGEKWYYRAFPVSTLGIINNLEDNNITYTPAPVKLDPCTNLNISAQDEKVVITWEDSEETKTVEGQTATWERTVLVYKEGTTAPISLNDGIIAVEEKTLNQYSTSGFELAVDNGKDYSFSLFAITTDGAISEKTSETASMYVTLSLTTDEESLYGKQIIISYDDKTVTGSFNSSGSASFKISWIGKISISCSDGNNTANATLQITNFNVNINKSLSFFAIVTFADGTYDEISAMLDAHYSGAIDISDYWSVGDVRTIPISSISATNVGETQSAQNAEVVIIGFGHDDLVSPVNGNSKSAVSLQLKNSLETVGYMYSTYLNAKSSLWDGSPRQTWCNGVFKNALPTELVSLIKTVTKKAWRYANSDYSSYESCRTQQTTEDDCFLVSEFEVFGTQGLSVDIYGTVGDDGTQYEYYKTSSNRIKYLGVSGTSANTWWLRSSYIDKNGHSEFRCVLDSGKVGGSYSHVSRGVAPGFCI